MPWNEKQTSGLTLAMTLIFEFSRSNKEFAGVRIYWIVTGVTLDVGVPSTRLIFKVPLTVKDFKNIFINGDDSLQMARSGKISLHSEC